MKFILLTAIAMSFSVLANAATLSCVGEKNREHRLVVKDVFGSKRVEIVRDGVKISFENLGFVQHDALLGTDEYLAVNGQYALRLLDFNDPQFPFRVTSVNAYLVTLQGKVIDMTDFTNSCIRSSNRL